MLKHLSKLMTLGLLLVGITGTAGEMNHPSPPARQVALTENTELPLPLVAVPAPAPRAVATGETPMKPAGTERAVLAGHCHHCNQANCYGRCYHQFATDLQPTCPPPRRHQILKRIWHSDQQYFRSQVTPPCPGYFVNQFWEVQKGNGRLAQYVFYGFHFSGLDEASQVGLTKSGRTKVMELARIWHLTPGPIYLIPSGDDYVDDTRLNVALQALNQQGLPISPEDVVLADPSGPSLMGVEANQIFMQRLQGSPLNPVGGTQGGGSQSTTSSGGNAGRGGGR